VTEKNEHRRGEGGGGGVVDKMREYQQQWFSHVQQNQSMQKLKCRLVKGATRTRDEK
jgi:hypothetical protein